jgi:iron(III) transport system permease protein
MAAAPSELAHPAFWEAVRGTVFLVMVGAALATILGASAAWCVTFCDFPGRTVFAWLLATPLAAPVYVLAYAYGGLTGPGGIAPLHLGGESGVLIVYALAFYPYVYLSARAAFASASFNAWEAARAHGAGPLRATLTITAPLAWPGIAAGAALAAMEIAADYGAAHYFGATTLTTQAFRAWFSNGQPQTALQLASLLLVGAFALLWLEHAARGQRGFANSAARSRPLTRLRLTPAQSLCAFGYCALLVTLAVIAPLCYLLRLAAFAPPAQNAIVFSAAVTSVALAGVGTVVTLALSFAIAISARHGRGVLFAASAGYAAPGAAMALGGLAWLAYARESGLVQGLSVSLALGALLWIYAARFAAAGAQPFDAGLTRISGAIGAAALTLGATPWRRFYRVSLPLAAPSAAAAGLIVFAEILKELPATLILRPLNTDTLAILAHSYASDERLMQAAAPALLITLVGAAPVLILARRLDGRPA